MEEFQESEILWPHHHDNGKQLHRRHHCKDLAGGPREGRRRPEMQTGSRPISIIRPNLVCYNVDDSWLDSDNDEEDHQDDEGNLEKKRIGGIMVPPHVMVERRLSSTDHQKMAFSFCAGNNGRTLKGRHLSQVRNSVLRMTGFLETC